MKLWLCYVYKMSILLKNLQSGTICCLRLFQHTPAKEKTQWQEGQSINDKNRMLITVEAGRQVLGGLLYYSLYFMYV